MRTRSQARAEANPNRKVLVFDDLDEANRHNRELESRNSDLQKELGEANHHIRELESRISDLQKELREANQHIRELESRNSNPNPNPNRKVLVFDDWTVDEEDYRVLEKIRESIWKESLEENEALHDWVENNHFTPMHASSLTKFLAMKTEGFAKVPDQSDPRVRNLLLPLCLSYLPPETCELTGLFHLSLEFVGPTLKDSSFTKKRSDFPSVLWEMTNLKTLRFRSGWKLSLPNEIENLKNLEELDLDFGIPAEGITPSIWKLTNLKKLRLRHSGEFFDVPSEIGNLTKLEQLDITSWTTSLPRSIGMLTNLKTLDLTYTLVEEIPEEVGNLINLERLGINASWSCKLRSLPSSIGSLTNLKAFEVTNTKIVSLPDSIQNLRNLRHLDLSGNNELRDCRSLSKLTKLQEIILARLKSPRHNLHSVVKHFSKKCENLVRLDLTECNITMLDQAETIPLKLKELNLSGNPIMKQATPPENLVHLVNNAPALTSLGADPEGLGRSSVAWKKMYTILSSNLARSRIRNDDKPLPLALWPKVLNHRAVKAFLLSSKPIPSQEPVREPFIKEVIPSEPDAIYRLLQMFGAEIVFQNKNTRKWKAFFEPA